MKKLTKIISSILVIIISGVFFIYFKLICKTVIKPLYTGCSNILSEQIPFIILGIIALVYLIYTLLSKK